MRVWTAERVLSVMPPTFQFTMQRVPINVVVNNVVVQNVVVLIIYSFLSGDRLESLYHNA